MQDKRNGRRDQLTVERLEDRLVPDATSFVTSLYHNLLNRAPDPGGLAAWVNAINNGATNQQVATAIWRFGEHRTDEVNSYYESFLGRAPDPGEAVWINALQNGSLNEQGVETAFLTSSEFVNNHSTPQSYINGLYQDILGRAPQPAEELVWVNILSQSGKFFVTAAILTSTESYTRILNTDYQNYLNRVPDSAGLQAWLNSLQSGQSTVESVAEGILGSAEYAQKH